MTTSADLVREMIHETVEHVREAGGDVFCGNSERVEALWMEVNGHLRAADLCEMTGEYEGMTRHFEAVNRMLEKIVDELPE